MKKKHDDSNNIRDITHKPIVIKGSMQAAKARVREASHDKSDTAAGRSRKIDQFLSNKYGEPIGPFELDVLRNKVDTNTATEADIERLRLNRLRGEEKQKYAFDYSQDAARHDHPECVHLFDSLDDAQHANASVIGVTSSIADSLFKSAGTKAKHRASRQRSMQNVRPKANESRKKTSDDARKYFQAKAHELRGRFPAENKDDIAARIFQLHNIPKRDGSPDVYSEAQIRNLMKVMRPRSSR
jgi:hypothetical protein